MIDVNKIAGIGEFREERVDSEDSPEETARTNLVLYKVNNRVFLVMNKNTIEVRTDERLGKLLEGKYESVMRSRYFGKGGMEVVDSGQLEKAELEDLIRLSYNLTREIKE